MAVRSWPEVFAARVLARMPAFESGADGGAPLVAGELAIGLYRNDASGRDAVVVTTESLWLREATAWRRLAYAKIADATTPPEIEKHSMAAVRLTMRDGAVVDLPIRGGEGRFRDAFEFLRFLMNVLRA